MRSNASTTGEINTFLYNNKTARAFSASIVFVAHVAAPSDEKTKKITSAM